MTLSRISQLSKPSEVAEKISESEGLTLSYLLIKLEGEESGNGGNRYHCVLEAKDSTVLYFTHSGFGDSHEDARNNAALSYIQMLWSIISAVWDVWMPTEERGGREFLYDGRNLMDLDKLIKNMWHNYNLQFKNSIN